MFRYEKSTKEFRIMFEELNKDNYGNMIKLLKNLGLKEDKRVERMIKRMTKIGEKKSGLKRLPGKRGIDKVFESNKHHFHFFYAPYSKSLAGGWKSEELSGEDFLSLLYSSKG